MYDVQTGRWGTQDAKADKYYHASPYNYVLNNPTNCVDPDGKLVIFVNGYWNRALNIFGAAPGGGKEKYWNFFDTKFIGAARNFMGASKSERNMFVDGSSLFGGDQNGGDRYELGKKYAREHYEEIVAGLADGETIKFVGHSEGAAFAAGMAEYMSMRFGSNDGRNNPVETALYLSPDEADEFKTSKNFKTYEAYFSDDWVSPAHHIKGVDYEIGFKGGGKKYAHGKTVSAETLNRLKEIVSSIIGSGNFTVTETSDAIIYNRKEEDKKN